MTHTGLGAGRDTDRTPAGQSAVLASLRILPRTFILPPPDRGMYFILRLTQLIVRPDSRLGALRYKIAPKCLLPGPFGHSGVGGNPRVAGTVHSYDLVFTYPCQPPPDRGMYFILRLTQLIVRPDSRLGLLRYKIAPKCLLPGPFGHSGVGGNPGVAGTVRSYDLVFTYPCQPPPPRFFGRGHLAPTRTRSSNSIIPLFFSAPLRAFA